jgi:hypothetical protein
MVARGACTWSMLRGTPNLFYHQHEPVGTDNTHTGPGPNVLVAPSARQPALVADPDEAPWRECLGRLSFAPEQCGRASGRQWLLQHTLRNGV